MTFGLSTSASSPERSEFTRRPLRTRGLELDLDQDLNAPRAPHPRRRRSRAGILGGTHDWHDDVMTEGELGELLRATAPAVIAGEIVPGIDAATRICSGRAPGGRGGRRARHGASRCRVRRPAASELSSEMQPRPVAAEQRRAPSGRRATLPKLPLPVAPLEVVRPRARVAAGDDSNEVYAAKTRELPALVRISDLNAIAPAASASETERVQLQASPEPSVPSTEGVWPVSEDINLEDSNASTRGTSGESTSVPFERPIVRIAAASDGPGATRSEDEACTVAARRRSCCR